MRRLIVMLLAGSFAFCAGPALAQVEDEPVVDEPVETVDPVEDEVQDEYVIPPPDEECAYGEGEGDYRYCVDPCGAEAGDYGDYGDYEYCPLASGGGPEVRQEDDGPPPATDPPAATTAPVTETLPASSLPYTGNETLVIALIGLGFVMVGAGARLRLARR